MSSFDEDLKAKMREYLAKEGRKVQFTDSWGDGTPRVSHYGWTDYDAWDHVLGRGDGCHWVIPEHAVVKEETYSQFAGTFTGADEEVGLNVAGVSCACGRYTDVTIRVTSSLGDAIQALLGYDPSKQLEL
jgi:hypothetical protein